MFCNHFVSEQNLFNIHLSSFPTNNKSDSMPNFCGKTAEINSELINLQLEQLLHAEIAYYVQGYEFLRF